MFIGGNICVLLVPRKIQNVTIIVQDKQKKGTNLHEEPRDYRINYVNIDLRHQYGIPVADAQTSLLVKHPQRLEERRDGCFHMLKN